MTAGTLAFIRAAVARWAKLVPALLWHDPIFRYATIAAAFALFFLAARVMQDIAGPGAIPPAGQNTAPDPAGSDRVDQDEAGPDGGSASEVEPPVPGSATISPAQEDAAPAKITPGRSLDGIDVEPAPKDRFGTLPKGEPNP